MQTRLAAIPIAASAVIHTPIEASPQETAKRLETLTLAGPGAGLTEVRGILVDRAGDTVWTNRKTPDSVESRKQNLGGNRHES